ncbi:response regulator transcription factor [Pedobacter lithocola]|uniref:Response regulator transcription factor n=1 Tax=Pedobacter lithocola TaxID=1908239 RepID=A0ABV8P686_9SPHI
MNRILVVDDDLPTLEVIKLLFEMEGFNVMGLDNCSKLGYSIQTFIPNLILMDVIMGGIDGRDICKELKSSVHNDIPIVLMSVVNGFYKDEKKPLYSDDYIEKPFELDIMLSKIKILIKHNSYPVI